MALQTGLVPLLKVCKELQDTQIAKTMQQNAALTWLDVETGRQNGAFQRKSQASGPGRSQAEHQRIAPCT
jgi:hypothetical protein